MTVLDEFQRMFDEIVMPFIDKLGIEDEFLKPVFYTLRQRSNKFRSATTLLSARLCGGKDQDVLPIAAVSELIHSSIIIQDDIADRDVIKRGKKSAWRKYGICYALYSSLYVIPPCLKILTELKSPHAFQVEVKFLAEYQNVCRAQIAQVLLDLSCDIPYDLFLGVHMGKTAIGRWSISAPALFYGNIEQAKIFEDFAMKLGDAGSIKNDIEDFLENDDYEPFCSDIRKGRLTYPIYYYFSMCNPQEREDFLRIFGKNKVIDYSQIRQKILDKGVILHAIEKINRLVLEAINLLTNILSSHEKQLLIAWANNHNYSRSRRGS